jgi:hypothetical protein
LLDRVSFARWAWLGLMMIMLDRDHTALLVFSSFCMLKTRGRTITDHGRPWMDHMRTTNVGHHVDFLLVVELVDGSISVPDR